MGGLARGGDVMHVGSAAADVKALDALCGGVGLCSLSVRGGRRSGSGV